MPPSTGLRARVRAKLITEIKDQARRQLADEGAPGISLRAITRSMGMASSAIYRYFPSRDDLLTALISDAYDSLGEATEATDAACRKDDFGGRWTAVGTAIRGWAQVHPHEYGLVYGSPVPGYRAPQDTIGPASRVTLVLAGIVTDASASGALSPPPYPLPPLSTPATAEAGRLVEAAFPGVADETALRAVVAWTQLFGMVTFELFGHLEGVIADRSPVFERALLEMGAFVGLPLPGAVDTAAIEQEDSEWYLI
jgi:AcrR family transcriptional regulator